MKTLILRLGAGFYLALFYLSAIADYGVYYSDSPGAALQRTITELNTETVADLIQEACDYMGPLQSPRTVISCDLDGIGKVKNYNNDGQSNLHIQVDLTMSEPPNVTAAIILKASCSTTDDPIVRRNVFMSSGSSMYITISNQRICENSCQYDFDTSLQYIMDSTWTGHGCPGANTTTYTGSDITQCADLPLPVVDAQYFQPTGDVCDFDLPVTFESDFSKQFEDPSLLTDAPLVEDTYQATEEDSYQDNPDSIVLDYTNGQGYMMSSLADIVNDAPGGSVHIDVEPDGDYQVVVGSFPTGSNGSGAPITNGNIESGGPDPVETTTPGGSTFDDSGIIGAVEQQTADIKTELDENEGLLQSILDWFGDDYGDPETITDGLLSGNATYGEVNDKITGLADGTYKPFGSGLASVFPQLTYSGLCPIDTSNVNLIYTGNLINIDIFSVQEICDAFDFLRNIIDVSLCLLTWTFVYFQFTRAVEAT